MFYIDLFDLHVTCYFL